MKPITRVDTGSCQSQLGWLPRTSTLAICLPTSERARPTAGRVRCPCRASRISSCVGRSRGGAVGPHPGRMSAYRYRLLQSSRHDSESSRRQSRRCLIVYLSHHIDGMNKRPPWRHPYRTSQPHQTHPHIFPVERPSPEESLRPRPVVLGKVEGYEQWMSHRPLEMTVRSDRSIDYIQPAQVRTRTEHSGLGRDGACNSQDRCRARCIDSTDLARRSRVTGRSELLLGLRARRQRQSRVRRPRPVVSMMLLEHPKRSGTVERSRCPGRGVRSW